MRVPLSPSSIIQYWPMGVTLFGWEGNHRPGARQEVMAAYQQVNGLRSPVV